MNEIFAEAATSSYAQGPVTPPTSPSALCSTARASSAVAVTARCHQELSRHPANTPPCHPKALQDTLPDLPPPFIDPFDPSQPNSQSNSQDGARTHIVRERMSGTLMHDFMTAISATVWYRLTPLKADGEVEGFRADRRREGLKRCWKSWGSRMRVI